MPTRKIWKDADPARGGDGFSVDIGIDSDDHLLKYYDTGDSAARTVVNEEEAQTITGDKTFSGATTFTGAVVINDVTFEIGDDDKLTLGNDNDQVLVNRSTSLTANTALTSVILGTPVTEAVAANSLIVSNITASGDVMIAANRGGNSETYLLADSSAGQLKLLSPADHMVLNSVGAGKTVRLNSRTSTDTANSIIGFQSKPAAGAATGQNVIGCEISPRVNDTFALTGTGSLIGAHVDAYLKGTTGAIAGSVRGLQVEMVTDDAGNRAITGHVAAIRVRSAFSASGITGNFCPFRIEKAEVQTNSQNYDALFELTGRSPGVWHEDPATEVSGSIKGYIKVIVNDAARYIALYDTGPTD